MSIDLPWLDAQATPMADLLTRLANLNSASHNTDGLHRVAGQLEQAFSTLNPDISERIPLKPAQTLTPDAKLIHHALGSCLRFAKRPTAAKRILLVIHYDTVYPPDHPFQSVTRIDDHHLRGPGVADAKGGVVVLLHSLLAFERSPETNRLGWEVILNPDEEIGSPGSAPVLVEAAKRNHAALVFEPAPDPTHLVTQRKGSGNYSAVFRGRAAHAGREPHKGRNAVLAAARFALDVTSSLSSISPNVTVNVAKIEGGGPANVVPDLAIPRFNVRATTTDEQHQVESHLADLLATANRQDGIRATLDGQFSSPPWQMNDPSKSLFARLQSLARQHLHLDLHPSTSGGASDANKIASTAIATLDSLGPVGHSIHSDQETVHLPTLVERAKLAALLLNDLADSAK